MPASSCGPSHHFVTCRHHQSRFAGLIHAAEPAGVERRTAFFFFVEASILPDLHRIAASRARIAIAGDDDALLSISLALQFAPATMLRAILLQKRRTPARCERSQDQAI